MTDTQSPYDQRQEELEDALKSKLTDEFLATLEQAVRTCGWTVDHIESMQFVEWCFELAGKPKPVDLTVFNDPSAKE